jgi:hypothetical protein
MGKKVFYGEAANFPGAPANYDPENPRADGVAYIEHRQHTVREKFIKVETAKVRAPCPPHSTPPRLSFITQK